MKKWILPLTLVLSVTGFLFGFVLDTYSEQAFKQTSKAMEPNMMEGETYIASDAPFVHNAVVVYESPFSDAGEMWIHRLVAKEGDVVEMRKGVLYVNGENIDRQLNLNLKYCPKDPKESTEETASKVQLMGESNWTIPEGHCFLIGDNRTYSLDSRHFGPIEMGQLRGVFTDVK